MIIHFHSNFLMRNSNIFFLGVNVKRASDFLERLVVSWPRCIYRRVFRVSIQLLRMSRSSTLKDGHGAAAAAGASANSSQTRCEPI
mmetsp:Transcript_20204/g.36315  ORF Transcript_20204/g.36315 Transcript_20204/m.36315 type:complete len:86 (+) Transcript_20204:207-464(+)